MAGEKPTVTRADADSVREKLQELRSSLDPGAQLILDNVVGVFEEHVNDPKAKELLKDFPESEELLEEVSGYALAARRPEPEAATWTITTTVTIAASHPWITCSVKAPGGGGATRF